MRGEIESNEGKFRAADGRWKNEDHVVRYYYSLFTSQRHHFAAGNFMHDSTVTTSARGSGDPFFFFVVDETKPISSIHAHRTRTNRPVLLFE